MHVPTHYQFSEAQIFRMLAICTERPLDERRKLVDRKVAVMTRGHFPKSNLAETVQFVVQSFSFQEETRRLQSSKHTNYEHEKIFKSYSGRDLELEEGTYLEKKNCNKIIFTKKKNILILYCKGF